MFRGKMFFVTVNATVRTPSDLHNLRNEILYQFRNEPDLMLAWKIYIESIQQTVTGSDHELFTSDANAG